MGCVSSFLVLHSEDIFFCWGFNSSCRVVFALYVAAFILRTSSVCIIHWGYIRGASLCLPYLILQVTCGCQIGIIPQGISQRGNCCGRFAKSRRLDPGNFSRTTKDYRGADKGEAVRLNKPLEILSSNEMENKGSSSRQQRFSSTITSNRRISETRAPAEFSDATSPYVNQALRLWTERRREWVGTRERPQPAERREPVISWSTTYEDLLGTNRLLTKPIPLPEMVDFLVDVWEQEGLYE